VATIRRMARVYRWIKTEDLEYLRSRKCQELARARNRIGWNAELDVRRIAFNISEIDAELACRADQPPLPL